MGVLLVEQQFAYLDLVKTRCRRFRRSSGPASGDRSVDLGIAQAPFKGFFPVPARV
jgi:hypothetical protein